MARLGGGRFEGKKAVARMPSTHAKRLAPDEVADFEVSMRDLKFFDRASGTRSSPVPLT